MIKLLIFLSAKNETEQNIVVIKLTRQRDEILEIKKKYNQCEIW